MWPKYKKEGYPYSDSTQVPWQLTNETFVFLTTSFSIAEAKEIVLQKGRAILSLEVELLRGWVKPQNAPVFTIFSVDVEWADVSLANMEIPILLATFKRSLLPIDGWHRIARALQTGVTHLPCVVLNQSETKKIQF